MPVAANPLVLVVLDGSLRRSGSTSRRVFVARHGRTELTTTIFTAQAVRHLVERMLTPSGRRLDLSSPFVDALLPDGSRLHVVIPDITRAHWAINIRKFVVRAHHLDELVELGSLTAHAAAFLEAAVAAGLNIVVAGGTQAGKTTLLNCLRSALLRERLALSSARRCSSSRSLSPHVGQREPQPDRRTPRVAQLDIHLAARPPGRRAVKPLVAIGYPPLRVDQDSRAGPQQGQP